MVSAVASVIGFFVVNWFYLRDPRTGAHRLALRDCATLGIILAVVTLWLTNYFTHPDKGPVTETATAARTGPATLILSGLAEGLESSVWALMVIAATIIGAMIIFRESLALQFYGIALTGLGLLTTTGFILAMDTYGPITDNAHGIFEMGGIHQEEASRTLSWMDAIGNTTKALTKGLAIATAVLAAVSLFRSFIDEAHLGAIGVQINMPTVFVGLMIGGAVPFLFSSFAIKAVSRAAYQVVVEVRRQFREHPGIMEYKEKPDYSRCVDIVTASAQKELLGPGILAIFAPLLVGFGLGVGALGGFLGGTILTGQLMAVFMSNAGANWDNAKKKIRRRLSGRQGHRHAQGRRRRRYGRRSVQGHRGPGAQSDDQGDEPGRYSGGTVYAGRNRQCNGRARIYRAAVAGAAGRRSRVLQEGLDRGRVGRRGYHQGSRISFGLRLKLKTAAPRASRAAPPFLVRRGVRMLNTSLNQWDRRGRLFPTGLNDEILGRNPGLFFSIP